VATLKESVDHTHFEISQINSILHTTTTLTSQILFEALPPKIIAKFKNLFLSAITSNTLCATFWILHTLISVGS
jgi:hypothetical protein